MQSGNGGFAAFDVDNVHYRLNHIPFADHGALLDPPASDVTARVLTAPAIVGRPQDKQALEQAVAFLREEQEPDGSWFGRWGTNYIYGTWSVLTALAQARVRSSDEAVGRAVRWLSARQNADGGWGESNDTYAQAPGDRRPAASTSFQSAWALLGLMAAGQLSVTARADETLLTIAGMGCAAAALGARNLVGAGAAALVSWGMAGGLDPALAADTIFLPREVAAIDGLSITTARRWREQLSAALMYYHPLTYGTSHELPIDRVRRGQGRPVPGNRCRSSRHGESVRRTDGAGSRFAVHRAVLWLREQELL